MWKSASRDWIPLFYDYCRRCRFIQRQDRNKNNIYIHVCFSSGHPHIKGIMLFVLRVKIDAQHILFKPLQSHTATTTSAF